MSSKFQSKDNFVFSDESDFTDINKIVLMDENSSKSLVLDCMHLDPSVLNLEKDQQSSCLSSEMVKGESISDAGIHDTFINI